MANKQTTRERVAALLAEPDKATHDAITELQQALQADIAGWNDKLQTIGKNDSWMGAERRRLLESGDIDGVLRVDVEGERLKMQIAGATTQTAALRALDKAVYARESLRDLPKQYATTTAKLQAIGELNVSLLEAWRELEGVFSDTEAMRRAVQHSGEPVPIPGPELAEALQTAYAGTCPAPAPSVFINRGNVGDMLGLDAHETDTGGMRRTVVSVAA